MLLCRVYFKPSAATMAAIKPPFTAESAHQKVKFAQAMWNTQDPGVYLDYLPPFSSTVSPLSPAILTSITALQYSAHVLI